MRDAIKQGGNNNHGTDKNFHKFPQISSATEKDLVFKNSFQKLSPKSTPGPPWIKKKPKIFISGQHGKWKILF